MQYLLQDMLKLSLQDRLAIVEKLICTFVHTDYEQELKNLVQKSLEQKVTH